MASRRHVVSEGLAHNLGLQHPPQPPPRAIVGSPPAQSPRAQKKKKLKFRHGHGDHDLRINQFLNRHRGGISFFSRLRPVDCHECLAVAIGVKLPHMASPPYWFLLYFYFEDGPITNPSRPASPYRAPCSCHADECTAARLPPRRYRELPVDVQKVPQGELVGPHVSHRVLLHPSFPLPVHVKKHNAQTFITNHPLPPRPPLTHTTTRTIFFSLPLSPPLALSYFAIRQQEVPRPTVFDACQKGCVDIISPGHTCESICRHMQLPRPTTTNACKHGCLESQMHTTFCDAERAKERAALAKAAAAGQSTEGEKDEM